MQVITCQVIHWYDFFPNQTLKIYEDIRRETSKNIDSSNCKVSLVQKYIFFNVIFKFSLNHTFSVKRNVYIWF